MFKCAAQTTSGQQAINFTAFPMRRTLTTLATQFVSSFGLALALAHPGASAAVVEQGASVLFNFQIPNAQTPVRPMIYFGILECLARGEADPQGDPVCAGSVQVFAQLGGVELVPYLSSSWKPGAFPYFSFSDAYEPATLGVVDGEFSILYTSTVGAIEAAPYLLWEQAWEDYVRVDGVAVAAVPEPESAVLLALGLLGLVATRKRTTGRHKS